MEECGYDVIPMGPMARTRPWTSEHEMPQTVGEISSTHSRRTRECHYCAVDPPEYHIRGKTSFVMRVGIAGYWFCGLFGVADIMDVRDVRFEMSFFR